MSAPEAGGIPAQRVSQQEANFAGVTQRAIPPRLLAAQG